jgi:hypothetical protein
MRPLGEPIERNIELATTYPVARGGFTQVPNFILRDSALSLGAKVAYSMFLHFAWNNSCFPGQDRLAQHMGMSVSRVNEYIKSWSGPGSLKSSAPVRERPTSTASISPSKNNQCFRIKRTQ